MNKKAIPYLIDYIQSISVFTLGNIVSTIIGFLLYVKEHKCSLELKGFNVVVNGTSYNASNAYNIPNSHLIFFISGIITIIFLGLKRTTNKTKLYLFESEPFFFKKIGIGFIIGVLLFLTSLVFIDYVDNKQSIKLIDLKLHQALMMTTAISIFYPIIEEIIFRNILIKFILEFSNSSVLAIVISSFLWAAIHLNYNLPILFFLFIMGLILSTIRLKYNSIIIPISIHITNNLLSVLF